MKNAATDATSAKTVERVGTVGIAATVEIFEKVDAVKTCETAETDDTASADGPWLPLPVTDVSDVLGISVAIAPTHPESNLSDKCDTLSDAATLLLPTLTSLPASTKADDGAEYPASVGRSG